MRHSVTVATTAAILILGCISVTFSAEPIKVDLSNYQEAEVARKFILEPGTHMVSDDTKFV